MNVLRLVRLPRCQHGFEGGLANRDAAACELGMGAMAAGTSVRRRPLMDRRTLATSHISQGDHGTSQFMSPPRAHVVRVKALCKSARSIIRLYTPTGTDDWRVISCPFHLRLNLIMSFPWHATANTNSQPRSHTALRTAGHRTARGFLRFRVCRVTAAPVLRTQTYHTSQPDQRPSTCKFSLGCRRTCLM